MAGGRDAELAGRLREAAAAGQTALALNLLEQGAPFIVDTDGQTALHQAASAGHADTVSALLLAGCDASVQDFAGRTALQRAAAEGHLDIVRQLVKQGASIDHQDDVHGNTALHEAAWKGFSQTVAVLCKAKANFYIKNRGGFAALHLCCQNGHNETSRLLLLHGCKPDIKNNYGDTPLHTSARYGHAGVIRILVSGRCNPSEQNKNGDTALHIAAAMGRRKLTRILLESGCDPAAANKQGETSVDISRRKQLGEILAILQQPPPVLQQQELGEAHQPPAKSDKKREKTSSSSKENCEGGASRREKKRVRGGRDEKAEDPEWSPYGCHYQPDLEEFPLPRMNTLPDDPLRAGEQYFLDLAGNIKKGPTSKSSSCYCGPAFQKFEKKLEKDKKELMKHIDSSHSKLDTKISHLERKTRDQLFNLNQTMKESFASERSECLDRMDRRALRERIAVERQQAVRDVSLKRDLAAWLDKKLQEIETKHGADAKDAALLRSLALRASKRGKRAAAVMDGDGGTSLRRAVSEELLSEAGEGGEDSETGSYRGLRVSDAPSSRLRRNSAGESGPGRSSEVVQHSEILSHSTASESYCTVTDTGSCSSSRGGGSTPAPAPSIAPIAPNLGIHHSSGSLAEQQGTQSDEQGSALPVLQSNRMSSQRTGLIRPIPMCYNSENLPTHPNLIQPEPNKPPVAGYQTASDNQNYHFPSQMNPIRRFTTEVDIHHATPLMLDTAQLPPYRAPPPHLYHPRDRLPRPGPAGPLPPVDEDCCDLLEGEQQQQQQDLHRQLLNLPQLQSDVGSHDSHNDSGYSTRLGASAGPSPSLSDHQRGFSFSDSV